MAAEVGAAYVRLLPSLRGFSGDAKKQLDSGLAAPAERAGREVGGKVGGGIAAGLTASAGKISSAGNKMLLGVTGPLLLGFNKAEQATTNLGEAQNATSVVFGDAERKISAFGETSARTALLSERAFREAVTPIGAALINVGFSQDEAADASINLAKRAADMASVFNTDVDEALGAIQAGLRGEADPLERFGVGLKESAVTAKALELGLADTASELTEQQKQQARLALIMEQTDRVAGDVEKTFGSNANQVKFMAARTEDAAAAFGTALLPAKAKVLEIAGKLLDRFNGLSDGQKKMVVTAGLVVAALGPVLKVTSGLITAISGTVKAATMFGRLGIAAGKAGVQITTAFVRIGVQAATATARVVAQIGVQVARWAFLGVQSLLHAAKVAAAWLIAMGPIGLVIAAVAGAAALIIKHWDTIKRFVTQAAKAVVDFLRRHWPLILAILTGPFGLAVLAIIKHWDKIRTFTVDTWNAIIGFLKGLASKIGSAIAAVISTVVGVARDAWNGFRDTTVGLVTAYITFVTGIPGRILGALSTLITDLGARARNAWNAFINAAKEVIDREIAFFSGIPGRILDALGDVGRILYDAGKKIINGLLDGIKDAFGAVKDFVGGIAGKIADWKGPLPYDSKLLVPAGVEIIGGLRKGLESQMPDLRATLGDVTHTIRMAGAVTPAAVAPDRAGFDFPELHVHIGDRELTDIVRVELREHDGRLVSTMAAGQRPR